MISACMLVEHKEIDGENRPYQLMQKDTLTIYYCAWPNGHHVERSSPASTLVQKGERPRPRSPAALCSNAPVVVAADGSGFAPRRRCGSAHGQGGAHRLAPLTSPHPRR